MHDFRSDSYEVGEPIDAETVKIRDRTTWLRCGSEATHNGSSYVPSDESTSSLRRAGSVARAGYWPRVRTASATSSTRIPINAVFPAQDIFKTTWDVASGSWSPTTPASPEPLRIARGPGFEPGGAATRSRGCDPRRGHQGRNSLREARAAIESSARGLVAAEESYAFGVALSKRAIDERGLTDAETDLTRTRLESINARVDLQVAKVRLELALGRDAIARR